MREREGETQIVDMHGMAGNHSSHVGRDCTFLAKKKYTLPIELRTPVSVNLRVSFVLETVTAHRRVLIGSREKNAFEVMLRVIFFFSQASPSCQELSENSWNMPHPLPGDAVLAAGGRAWPRSPSLLGK